MRKLVLFLALLVFAFKTATSQNKQGQIAINVGAGYSPEFDGVMYYILGHLYPTSYNASLDNDDGIFTCSNITPNCNLTADYNVVGIFSLGIATSYQNEVVSWAPYYPPYWVDKITRINASTRLLFHLTRKSKYTDLYLGFRPGFCYWIDKPLNNQLVSFGYTEQRYSNFLAKTNYFAFCFQTLLGFRISVTKNVALHLEAGMGQPFALEGGCTFSFNTRKKKDDFPANNEHSVK